MSKMSEQKRISLTTLSSTVSSAAFGVGGSGSTLSASNATASLRFGNDFLAPPDRSGASSSGVTSSERKGNNKTIRLKLELFQTDSCSYPEFNYSKLLHLEKKKIKKLKQKTNGFSSDPFEEKDDDVERIAKELEKKYGTAYGSGRGRSKKDDHCDIGLGYDESDSFIDNTEAYDEVIPEEVETIEGGFYINCGALEFKKLHTESTTTKTDEIIKMPNRPKKRILSSSSEDSSSSGGSDDDEEEDDDEAEVSTGETSTTKAKNGPAEKRQKNVTGSAVIKKPNTQENGKKKDKPSGISSSSSNSPKPTAVGDELGSDSDKERMRQKATVKTTTVKDMLKAKRDSYLKMQVGGVETKTANGELKGAASKSSDDSSSEESDASEDGAGGNSDSNQSAPQDKKTKKVTTTNNEENSEKLRTTDTTLPTDLDVEVTANIQEFKEMVKSKSMTGKKFQMDQKLTDIFLKIDESLQCLEKQQRNLVFAHLEFQLLLPKYYFLRKAKLLRIKEEKLKSKNALGKLRKTVIETMPGAISNYEVELRKYAELQSGNLNSEHPPKMPKKKFPWNSNLRNLLYDVYQVRWTSYPVLGTRKVPLEDFINMYMKDKVVELWPNGWMHLDELQREIEKRKTAAKKAKEKSKKANTSHSTTAATNTGQNLVTTTATAKSQPQPQSNMPTTSYLKQFEEFATTSRSCANSDTDSVASSGLSSGLSLSLKRKKKDNNKLSNKQIKAPKNINGEPQMPPNIVAAAAADADDAALLLDLVSPTKRTDHSIYSIIANSTSPTPNCSTATGSNLSQQQPQQQVPKKHSMPVVAPPPTVAHVIDLDNYASASDILLTSKQMMNAAVAATMAKSHQRSTAVAAANITASNTSVRHDSSSESDGVEIVGFFPAKPTIAVNKQKYKKNVAGSSANSNPSSRSGTPNNSFHMDMNLYGAALKTSPTAINNNNNKAKSATVHGGGTGVTPTNFDVNEALDVLNEQLQDLKRRSVLTAAPNAVVKKESPK